MTREELDTLLNDTIVDVTDLPKKDRDRLIDTLAEVLVSDAGLELEDEDKDDEEEEPS